MSICQGAQNIRQSNTVSHKVRENIFVTLAKIRKLDSAKCRQGWKHGESPAGGRYRLW